MMADPINTDHKSSLLNRLVRWWRSRRSPRVRASDFGQVADAREAAAGSTNVVLPENGRVR
jgi:hypothetical protein